MKIKVIFFGNLAEKAGMNKDEWDGLDQLSAVREKVEQLVPDLKGQVYLTAVNQDLVRGECPLKDGDEVAIMPPFAGG